MSRKLLFEFASGDDEKTFQNMVKVYDNGTYKAEALEYESQFKIEDGILYYRHLDAAAKGDMRWRKSDTDKFNERFMQLMNKHIDDLILCDDRLDI